MPCPYWYIENQLGLLYILGCSKKMTGKADSQLSLVCVYPYFAFVVLVCCLHGNQRLLTRNAWSHLSKILSNAY